MQRSDTHKRCLLHGALNKNDNLCLSFLTEHASASQITTHDLLQAQLCCELVHWPSMACADLSRLTAVTNPAPASNMLSPHPADQLQSGTSQKLQGQVGWLVECLTCHHASSPSAATSTAHHAAPAASQAICSGHPSRQQLPQLSSPPHEPQQSSLKPETGLVDSECNQNLASQQPEDPGPSVVDAPLGSRAVDQNAADLTQQPIPQVKAEPAGPETGPLIAQPVPAHALSPGSSPAADAQAPSVSQCADAALRLEQSTSMLAHPVKPSLPPMPPGGIKADSAELGTQPAEKGTVPACDNWPAADCSPKHPKPDANAPPLREHCALASARGCASTLTVPHRPSAQPAAAPCQALSADAAAADHSANAGDAVPASSPQQAVALPAPDTTHSLLTCDWGPTAHQARSRNDVGDQAAPLAPHNMADGNPSPTSQQSPPPHALPVQESSAVTQSPMNTEVLHSPDQRSDCEVPLGQLKTHKAAGLQLADNASAVSQSATAQPSKPAEPSHQGAHPAPTTPSQAVAKPGNGSRMVSETALAPPAPLQAAAELRPVEESMRAPMVATSNAMPAEAPPTGPALDALDAYLEGAASLPSRLLTWSSPGCVNLSLLPLKTTEMVLWLSACSRVPCHMLLTQD